MGCRDTIFLLGFQEAFPNKIKSAIGGDINDKGFKNVKYKKPIKLKVMNCSKKLKFDDNTFDFIFTKDMFESSVSVHNIVETEYTEGTFGYDLSLDIAWLYKESTGALSKEEYDEYIDNLKSAQKEGHYIFSKPYFIYKGVKK